MIEPFNGEQYSAGLAAGDRDADAGKDFVEPTGHRDYRTGYTAGFDNYFVDPCDNRAERAFTANAYDR